MLIAAILGGLSGLAVDAEISVEPSDKVVTGTLR